MPKLYILSALLAATALAGCGLKGDLYLPSAAPPQAATDSGNGGGNGNTNDDGDENRSEAAGDQAGEAEDAGAHS